MNRKEFKKQNHQIPWQFCFIFDQIYRKRGIFSTVNGGESEKSGANCYIIPKIYIFAKEK